MKKLVGRRKRLPHMFSKVLGSKVGQTLSSANPYYGSRGIRANPAASIASSKLSGE